VQIGSRAGILGLQSKKGSEMSAYEALKAEIRRLARKEAKALFDGSIKATRGNKKLLSDLKQEVQALKREILSLKRSTGRAAQERPAAKETATRERITAKGITSLRVRLGLSQADVAQLCGVSSGAVSHWEAQRSQPKGEAVACLVELRTLGKKEVTRRLEGLRSA
jgi:DNA-binding transcriptional regulator YiaG